MQEKIFFTDRGVIHYWTNNFYSKKTTLVFLPGLTADHRLFEKQIEYFQDKYNCFVWDAPGHGASTPFQFTFSLEDKAIFLHDILEREKIKNPVLIGQSMGGYVAQMYMELYPNLPSAFVSIDSAPLQKEYVTVLERWLLKHMEGIYRIYPWKLLVKYGAEGCAISSYGRQQMALMIQSYTKKEYCKLAGNGLRLLSKAITADKAYDIPCPAILLCGEFDRAGFTKKYNKAWSSKTGIPIYWIKNAGHNSNADQPKQVNQFIENFLHTLV